MVDDDELLEAWRAGDRRAGEDLVRRHFAAVLRFFRNKAWGDCEDLAQATFLRCTEIRDRFGGRSSFRTFLFSVARNVLLEHYRSKRGAKFDPASSSVADLDPSPSQIAANLQWQRTFFDALRRIPIEMQVVLELYYWEGLGTEEIAEVVEVPRGTVKSRLFHARQQVRRRCERAGIDVSGGLSLPGWARDFEAGPRDPQDSGTNKPQ